MATSTSVQHGLSNDKAGLVVPRSRQPFWAELFGKMRGRAWQIGIGSLAVVVVLVFAYWKIFAPVDVRSHEVETGEIVAEIMGTGTVEAHVKVTISTKISGRLTEVLVDQGDQVKSQQVLARLKDPDLQRQVEVEEATVSARKATVERLMADKNFAKSTLELAIVQQNKSSP